jgi:hypothetical protein
LHRCGRLQHVEALDDEDVGALHHNVLARDDVVREVRVHGCEHVLAAGLDLCDEAQQAAPVVRLRKALAAQQISTLELCVGKEEAVSGDQLDPRRARSARQQLAQQPSGGRLADGDRPGDADDERRATGCSPRNSLVTWCRRPAPPTYRVMRRASAR